MVKKKKESYATILSPEKRKRQQLKKEARAREAYAGALDAELDADIERLARGKDNFQEIMDKTEVARKMNFPYPPLKPGQKHGDRKRNVEYDQRMEYHDKNKWKLEKSGGGRLSRLWKTEKNR